MTQEEKLDRVLEKMEDHTQSLVKIEIAIGGNDELKQEGMKTQLDRHEKSIKDYEKKKSFVVWIGGVIGAALAFIGDQIKHFFN